MESHGKGGDTLSLEEYREISKQSKTRSTNEGDSVYITKKADKVSDENKCESELSKLKEVTIKQLKHSKVTKDAILWVSIKNITESI